MPSVNIKKKNRLKVKGCKKIYHTNINHKKSRMALLLSHKADFTTKNMSRDTKAPFVMIKESFNQENIAVINV